MTMRAVVVATGLIGTLLGGGIFAGNRLYRAGEYGRAAEAYAEVISAGDSSAAVRYNHGTALLRLERWDEARSALEAAAHASSGGERSELAFRATYNSGNADLEPVFRVAAADTARATALRRAVARYRAALLLRPVDGDAKWNLELATRLLREETGGGGGTRTDDAGGGGQGADDEAPAPEGVGAEAGGSGTDAEGLEQSEAARLLAGADRAERELQRRRLRQGSEPPPPGTRDW